MIRSLTGFSALIFLILLDATGLKAQLSFPDGKTLNLETHLDYVYFETMIKFNTGHYRIYDYRYEKIYDSLDKNWLVTACFNGDCHNALEQSGSFINILSNPDSTGFIAFHVETNNSNGRSAIAYRVVNTKDTSDHAVLTFHIIYTGLAGTGHVVEHLPVPALFPNPAQEFIQLDIHESLTASNCVCRIFSSDGRIISTGALPSGGRLDISGLSNGIYYIRLMLPDKNYTLPFRVLK